MIIRIKERENDMKESKKGLLFVMFALFVVLALPTSSKAMSLVPSGNGTPTDNKATTVFTVDKTAVTVYTGKTSTVTVKFQVPKAATVTALTSNNNAKVQWTGWSLSNNKLVITGVSAGTTTITLKNTYNSQTRKITVTVKKPNPVTYRAAIVGQYDYKYNQDLPACKNDAAAMARTCQKSGYSSVKTKYNASASGIKSLISTTFANADSNDVSLFYYSGHGASNGALCTIESSGDNLLYISDLASWLKQVPGTVIVLFDSCFSGMSINKAADGTITTKFAKSVSNKDTKAFNSAVVNEFAKADAQVKAASKSGELATSKFKVITACSKSESSYCNQSFSYFTYAVVEGAGINYSSGAVGTAPADSDGNKTITINECYKFAKSVVEDYQTAQVYPTNCSTRIFKR